MTSDMLNALRMVADEKSIPLDDLIATIESAVAEAAMKRLGKDNLTASFNRDTEKFELFEFLEPVDGDDGLEPDTDSAKQTDPLEEPERRARRLVRMTDLGRIAAQSVRRIIHKKGIEGERQRAIDGYMAKQGEMITGQMVKRAEGEYLFNIGDLQAVLPASEQLVNDRFERGRPVKLIVVDVNTEQREPVVVVSRTHPNLLQKLIERETPEIGEGLVDIISTARDRSGRSKVAVRTRKHDVDPVGACIGIRGGRVQPVVRELAGEKIDIVRWDTDPEKFIAAALTPAKNMKVILNDRDKIADVIVKENELSMAVGKKGVNIKLAIKITKWNIDVMSQLEYQEKQARITRQK